MEATKDATAEPEVIAMLRIARYWLQVAVPMAPSSTTAVIAPSIRVMRTCSGRYLRLEAASAISDS